MQKTDIPKTRRRIEDALRKSATPEVLIKIAKTLGVEVAFISEDNRPCFGSDQVRYTHQLKKGLEYLAVHGRYKGSGRMFTVRSEPFYRTGDSTGWWVEVEYHNGSCENISLQDGGIVPYEGTGRWNASNWIAFTDKSRYLVQPHFCCHHHCCGCHCHHHC